MSEKIEPAQRKEQSHQVSEIIQKQVRALEQVLSDIEKAILDKATQNALLENAQPSSTIHEEIGQLGRLQAVLELAQTYKIFALSTLVDLNNQLRAIVNNPEVYDSLLTQEGESTLPIDIDVLADYMFQSRLDYQIYYSKYGFDSRQINALYKHGLTPVTLQKMTDQEFNSAFWPGIGKITRAKLADFRQALWVNQ